MSRNVIVLAGLSNSGKSSSFKYLDPKSTFIISCTNKALQIPGYRKKYKQVTIEDKKLVGNWFINNSYDKIKQILNVVSNTRNDIKTIIIDDINYCLSGEIMDNALVKGFEKFSLQAKNYYELFIASQNLREDITVVLVSHIINNGTDLEPDWGLYTSGKMLERTVNINGLFSYIIFAERYEDDNEEVQYRFRTKTNGNDVCRSTAGCFPEKYIEPNLQKVIDRINEFEEGDQE